MWRPQLKRKQVKPCHQQWIGKGQRKGKRKSGKLIMCEVSKRAGPFSRFETWMKELLLSRRFLFFKYIFLYQLLTIINVSFACRMSYRLPPPPANLNLHKKGDKPTLTIDFSLFFVCFCVKMSIVWLSKRRVCIYGDHTDDILHATQFSSIALLRTWNMGGDSTCTHAVIVQTFVGRLDRLRPEEKRRSLKKICSRIFPFYLFILFFFALFLLLHSCVYLSFSLSIRCKGYSASTKVRGKAEPAVPTGGGDAASGSAKLRSVRLNISHSYDICHDGFASLSLTLSLSISLSPLSLSLAHLLWSALDSRWVVSGRTDAAVVAQWSIGSLCSLHQSASGSLANISDSFFFPFFPICFFLFLFWRDSFQMSRVLIDIDLWRWRTEWLFVLSCVSVSVAAQVHKFNAIGYFLHPYHVPCTNYPPVIHWIARHGHQESPKIYRSVCLCFDRRLFFH